MKKIILKYISPSVITALAMTGTTVQSAEQIEEIVVVGIKASVKQALDIKREAASFVDAISSEDVGKLPDQNVAEALQRVPGVAIERSRGEGNFVSIRGLGPQFTRATLNGRTIATSETGRQFNFDVLAAEAVDGIDVHKSPTASLEEGGIGGTVDIKTVRPLDIGSKAAFSASGYYNDLSEEATPRVSGLYSWTSDDDTFGVMVSGAFSERDIREDATGTLFFLSAEDVGQTDFYDTDLDGVGDLTEALFFPLANNESLRIENRERTSLNAAVQWQPDDTTEFTMDLLYSKFDIENTRYAQTTVYTPAGIFGSPTDHVNPDGSFRVQITDRAPENSSVITGAAFNNFNITSIGVDERIGRDLIAWGSNVTKEHGSWTASLDTSYSLAKGSTFFNQAVLEATATPLAPGEPDDLTQGRTFPASFQIDGRTSVLNSDIDLSNADFYTTRNHRIDINPTRDEEFAVKFDLERDLDGDIISGFKVGAGFRAREKSVENARFESSATLIFPVIGGISTQFPVDNFSFPSGVENFLYPIPGPSTDYVFDQLDGEEQIVVNAPNSFVISEDVLSAYVQFDIDSEFAGMPVVGNVGLRYVQTNQVSSGSAPAFVNIVEIDGPDLIEIGDISPVSRQNDYSEILPSLNLRFEVQEDMFVRFAASKVLTRPELNDLSPRLEVNATIASADTGNPFLNPFVSTQFDAGFEWYFSDASIFNAAIFHKDIGDFIQGVTVSNAEFLGETFINLTQPRNLASAEVTGFEIGYQQSFDFLSAPFDGLGFIANYTYNDSEQTIITDADAGTTITSSFQGVSEDSYNLIGYYDKGRVQARIAYSYRSDFVDQASASFGNEISTLEFGQFDAFASFDVLENVSVFFEAVNLTDEALEQDVSGINGTVTINQPFQTFANGRRFGLGVRASF